MPPDEYDDIISSVLPSSGTKPPRLKNSHLDELSDFAKENNLTVGSTTGGTHNRGSKHYTGNAIDIKNSGRLSDEQVRSLSQQAQERGFKLRDERRRPPGQAVWGGPHVHLEHDDQDPYDDVINSVLNKTAKPVDARGAYAARANRPSVQEATTVDPNFGRIPTPRVTSTAEGADVPEVLPTEFQSPGVSVSGLEPPPAPKPISFKQATAPGTEERVPGVRGLIADRYESPVSTQMGELRTAKLPANQGGNVQALTNAALESLGPEYVKSNEAYRAATGRNLITIDNANVRRDGSFDFQPTKQAIDFINAFHSGLTQGGVDEGLRRAMAVNVSARQGERAAYEIAKAKSAKDVQEATTAAEKTKDNFFTRGVTEGMAPLAQGVGTAAKVVGMVPGLGDVGGLLATPAGEELQREARVMRAAGEQASMDRPAQTVGENVLEGAGGLIPTAAGLLATQGAGAAQLPLLGALQGFTPEERFKGAAQGAVFQGAMAGAPKVLSTLSPTAQKAVTGVAMVGVPAVEAVAAGQSPVKAIVENLPFAALPFVHGEKAPVDARTLDQQGETLGMSRAQRVPDFEGTIAAREAAVKPVTDARGNVLLNADEVAQGGKPRIRAVNQKEANGETSKENAPQDRETTTSRETTQTEVPTNALPQTGDASLRADSAQPESVLHSVPVDPYAEIIDSVIPDPHHSSLQNRRARNTATGTKGQFKPGKIESATQGASNDRTSVSTGPVDDQRSGGVSTIQPETATGDARPAVASVQPMERVVSTQETTAQTRSPTEEVENATPDSQLTPEGQPPGTVETKAAGVEQSAPVQPAEPSTTAAKNAKATEDRLARGEEPLPRPESKRDTQLIADAKAANEADSSAPSRIADEVVNGTKKQLTDTETIQLDLHVQKLKNEHSALDKQIAEATNPEVIKDLTSRSEAIEREWDKIDRANDAAGTEWGRAGRARRLEVNQNFDLLPMISRAKKARGRDLSPEERQTIKGQSDRIAALEKQVTKANTRNEELQAQKAVERIKSDVSRETRRQARSAKKLDLDSEAATLKNLIAQAWKKNQGGQDIHPAGLAGLDPEGEITKLVVQLAKNRIKKGTVTAAGLVDEVHGLIKDVIDDKRVVRDMIARYPRTRGKETRSELQKQLDAHKSELYRLSSEEDIEAGRRLPRAPGPRTSDARRLPMEGPRESDIRRVPVQGPRLSDINKLPAQGPRMSEARKSGVPLQGPKLSDINKVPLQGPRMSEASRSGQPLQGPRLSDIRRVPLQGPKPSDAFKLRMSGPRLSDANKLKMAGPRMEDAPKLGPRDTAPALRKRLQSQIDTLERRIATGDFSKAEQRGPTVYDRNTLALQKQLEQVKRDYENANYRATRGTWGRIKDTAASIGNIPKTMKSMADISAVFRQGGFYSLTHPIEGLAKPSADMLRAFTETGYRNVENAIKAHPKFDQAKRDGVEFTGVDKNDPNLSHKEEGYFGTSAIDTLAKGKYNPVRVVKGVADFSERTFVSFLDSQRMHMYDTMTKGLESQGLSRRNAPDSYKAIAKLINQGTGRGDLGVKGNQAAPLLNLAMFSPRLVASRVQLLNNMFNPAKMARMPAGARRQMITDNVKFLAATAAVMGLAKAAGGTVNTDPDDGDFLKIRFGKTTYDTLTGMQQPMRYIVNMGRAIKGGETYAGKGKSELTTRFLRSKASPFAGVAVDYLSGSDFEGRRFSAKREARDMVTPLPINDFVDAMKAEGLVKGFAKALPGLTGVGVQTYDQPAEPATTQAEKLARKFIGQKMPDEARTDEEIDRGKTISTLRARSRKGEDVSKDIKDLGAKITTRQANAILGARNKTRLQEDFNRLGIKEALIVYGVATPGQQKEVRDILERKTPLVDLLPADEQADVKQRLDKLGMKRGSIMPKPKEAPRMPTGPKRDPHQGYVFSQ